MTAPRLRPCALLSTSAILATSLLSPTAGWGFSSVRPRLDLVIATSQRANSPDPRSADDARNRPLVSWTHDRLFEWTYMDHYPKLRTVLAAERGTFDSTRKKLTLRVKQGLTFSNGEPIQARHFVAAWESLKSLPSDSIAHRAFLSRIRSFDARSDDTLIIELTAPDPDFEMRLALPFTAPIPLGDRLLPKAPAISEPFAGTATPLPGSGPYVLNEWQPGFGLILRARPGYSHSFYPTEAAREFRDLGYLEHSSKPLPQTDGIRIDWMPDSQSAWKAFRDGKADLLEVDSSVAREALEKDKPWLLQSSWLAKGIKLEKGWKPSFTLALVNLKTLPRIEERRSILSKLGREFWSTIPGFIEGSLPSQDLAQLPQLEHWIDLGSNPARSVKRTLSPKKAATKVAPAGRVLRLQVLGQDEQSGALFESAQKRLESAGFAVTSSSYEDSSALKGFRDGEIDVLILGWNWETPTWRSVVEPILWLQPESTRTKPEWKALETAASSSQATAAAAARLVNQQLENLAAWSPGPRHHRHVLVQPWVFGFHVRPAVENPEKYLRVDHELRKNYLAR